MTNPQSPLPQGEASDTEMPEATPPSPHRRRLYDTSLRSADLGSIARAAVPSTRRFVRRHPYAGLLGAALVGVWLVRGKPLRTLSSSVVFGLAARRFLTSLPSGVLGRLRSAPRSRGASNPPR